ncbi:MAG: hypothetical protein EU530_09780 [Promethearchaeota archaeon]|nr:MAG: hypothetical protein EU530_09780 [Candidatus Lokiarchaeota archaeon]
MFFAGLREITKTKEVILPFGSPDILLRDVIKNLIEKYPKLTDVLFQNVPPNQIDEYLGNEMNFELTKVKFAKNRKIIAHATQDVIFGDGDTLAIFLPLMGG